MKNPIVGYVLLAVGAIIAYRSVTGFGFSLVGFAIGCLIIVLGWTLSGLGSGAVRSSRLPANFNAAYSYKNIALDTTTGQLWVKDQNGRTGLLEKNEVVGIEMKNSVFQSQSVIGPRETPMDNKLFIKTKSLDRPVWTVRFGGNALTGGGSQRDHEALRVWYERLNAFYNHTA